MYWFVPARCTPTFILLRTVRFALGFACSRPYFALKQFLAQNGVLVAAIYP
jgi:hypothetical protein